MQAEAFEVSVCSRLHDDLGNPWNSTLMASSRRMSEATFSGRNTDGVDGSTIDKDPGSDTSQAQNTNETCQRSILSNDDQTLFAHFCISSIALQSNVTTLIHLKHRNKSINPVRSEAHPLQNG